MPGSQHRAGPIPACLKKEPLPRNQESQHWHWQQEKLPVITQQTELKPQHKAGGFLPPGKTTQFCKENCAFASLTFKRGLQLSLGTSQDNDTKRLAQLLMSHEKISHGGITSLPSLVTKISFPSPDSQSKEPDPLLACLQHIISSLFQQRSWE